jgi:predicted Zn finger-like uncharacterized protein
MILICPACSTRYLVAPTAIGSAGRKVRCAKCQQTWLARPPPDAPPPLGLVPSMPPPAPPPDLGPPRYPVPAVRRRGPRPWVVAGWTGLAAAVILIVAGLTMGRDSVMAQWPRSARLYQLVGLAAEPLGTGLQVRQVTSARAEEDGAPALVVEGEIANVSEIPREVPPLKVVLHDRERREVQSWSFPPEQSQLPPGATLAFKTRIPRLSEAATGFFVTFAGGA